MRKSVSVSVSAPWNASFSDPDLMRGYWANLGREVLLHLTTEPSEWSHHLALERDAKYCNLSVCLISFYISKTTLPNFASLCVLPVVRFSFGSVATLCTSGLVDVVMLSQIHTVCPLRSIG